MNRCSCGRKKFRHSYISFVKKAAGERKTVLLCVPCDFGKYPPPGIVPRSRTAPR